MEPPASLRAGNPGLGGTVSCRVCTQPGHYVIYDVILHALPAALLIQIKMTKGMAARRVREVEALGFEALVLPSTSPANASWSFERKLVAWRAALA